MIKKNSLKSTMTVTNFKTVVAWFHSRLAAQKALSSPIPDCLGLWLLIRCFKANRACGTWQLYCGIPTTAADCCSRPASGVGERKHTNSPTLLQKPEIRALSVFLLGTGLGFSEKHLHRKLVIVELKFAMNKDQASMTMLLWVVLMLMQCVFF